MMRLAAMLVAVMLATEAGAVDPRVQLGLVPVDVMEGARLFFEETFGGNGRTCGTCHPAEHNLTLGIREVRNLPVGDLVFAAHVPGLERIGFLREYALVVENVDGFADPIHAFTLRAIPHVLSLALTRAPVDQQGEAVGWSGDGAPGSGTLRDFSAGAVVQHFPTSAVGRQAGVHFRLPTEGELDAMLAFMSDLGRTEEIDLASVRLSDPRAERGRAAFLRVGCNGCHENAGANRAPRFGGGNSNLDTGVEALRPAGAPVDDGHGNPGDGRFNIPSLIEAADTPPFFHNSAARTIEQAVRFYSTPAFAEAPDGFPLAMGAVEAREIALMLRVLNAALNAQMAAQRLDAAGIVERSVPGDPVVARLLTLAVEEAIDGAVVLLARQTRPALSLLRAAHRAEAARVASGAVKIATIDSALDECRAATSALGTGLEMDLGAGNLAP